MTTPTTAAATVLKWKRSQAAAAHIKVSIGTLRNWASMGIGPRSYNPSGGRRLYLTSDLDEWILSGGKSAKASA